MTQYRQKYRGSYALKSRGLRAAAYANPDTRCWRCGRTLAQVAFDLPGRKVTWDAGHTDDPARPLAAECSPCNRADGARKAVVARMGAARSPAPVDLNPSRRWY